LQIITDSEYIVNSDLVPAYGSPQSFGHINFRPNGGKNQPGCIYRLLEKPMTVTKSKLWDETKLKDLRLTTFMRAPTPPAQMNFTAYFGLMDGAYGPACNHQRAVLLFVESLDKTKAQLKAFQCHSYELFNLGECLQCANGGCSVMGLQADLSVAEDGQIKDFYVNTMENSPYFLKTMTVEFDLTSAALTQSAATKKGYLSLTMHGKKESTSKLNINESPVEFVPGSKYRAVIESSTEIGAVQSFEFSWKTEGFHLPIIYRPGYLYVNADVEVLDGDNGVRTFRLLPTKIREDVVATAVPSI
jgi:hypothetical protein